MFPTDLEKLCSQGFHLLTPTEKSVDLTLFCSCPREVSQYKGTHIYTGMITKAKISLKSKILTHFPERACLKQGITDNKVRLCLSVHQVLVCFSLKPTRSRSSSHFLFCFIITRTVPSNLIYTHYVPLTQWVCHVNETNSFLLLWPQMHITISRTKVKTGIFKGHQNDILHFPHNWSIFNKLISANHSENEGANTVLWRLSPWW